MREIMFIFNWLDVELLLCIWNCFFVFLKNGGWLKYYGNNYLLRGGKFMVYEGGIWVVFFVYGMGL